MSWAKTMFWYFWASASWRCMVYGSLRDESVWRSLRLSAENFLRSIIVLAVQQYWLLSSKGCPISRPLAVTALEGSPSRKVEELWVYRSLPSRVSSFWAWNSAETIWTTAVLNWDFQCSNIWVPHGFFTVYGYSQLSWAASRSIVNAWRSVAGTVDGWFREAWLFGSR